MNMGTMVCNDARPLVPSYLDGEISEAQAGPLRKHLLACQACRASAQAGKHLKRWFAPTQLVPVPRDFAARVTRMAFASADVETSAHESAHESELDRLETITADQEVSRRAVLQPARATNEAAEGRVLAFVLRLAVAAAILAVLSSVAIQSLRRPSTADLRADDSRTMTLDQALEKLDRIEDAERTTKSEHVTPVSSTNRPR